ncbi:MAG: hypothetical protein AAFP70_02160 [Calditrichota bacterium]
MQAVAQPALFDLLLTLFYNLRAHNFSLGISEFKLALQAFSYGFGADSEEDLIFTLQVLWGKSTEEQEELRRMLIEALQEQREAATVAPDDYLEKEEQDPAPGFNLRKEEHSVAPGRDPEDMGFNLGKEGEQGVTPGRDPGKVNIPLNFLPEMPVGGQAIRIPKIKPLQINANLDLVGSYPVRQRHMKRAWRYYRLMRQDGPATVLDIPGTVEQVAQNGLLLHPVMRAHRTNQAELLLLVDSGGSMVPFQRIVQRLLVSVRQGGLSRYAVYYFHDVPRKALFTDAARTIGVDLTDVLNGFHDAGVMIISDAGSARQSNSNARVRRTGEFVDTLKRYTPHVAWVNPTPEERWSTSSAGDIANMIHMFSLDRNGLDNAIDCIRGKDVR